MKRLALVIMLLLFCAYSEAQTVVVVGRGAATAAPSYLLSENFDGATACGDGSHTNCNNTWSVIPGSSFDFNYATSPAPLVGTYSGRLNEPVNYDTGIAFDITPTSPVYFYFILHVKARATGKFFYLWYDEAEVMSLADVGPELGVYCGTKMEYTSALENEHTYYIWGDYTKGTGANATCRIYSSETNSKPSATVTITGADGAESTTDAAAVVILTPSTVQDLIFDKIRVSSTDITGVPD